VSEESDEVTGTCVIGKMTVTERREVHYTWWMV